MFVVGHMKNCNPESPSESPKENCAQYITQNYSSSLICVGLLYKVPKTEFLDLICKI